MKATRWAEKLAGCEVRSCCLSSQELAHSLDEVGKGRLPSRSDPPRRPLCEAPSCEALRLIATENP